MCGFLVLHSRCGALNIDLVSEWRDTLIHRGPDDAGTWVSNDGSLAMAHRRLAILDLTPNAHQPMRHPSENKSIIFNGEIYNHQEIRHDIGSRWSFKSSSDTETLLAAYCIWGVNCLDHLQGMFAFVIHDGDARRLFAARDRVGEKPFFYRAHSGGFEAASELKALLASASSPRDIDARAFDSYLTHGYVPGDACILKGYNKLPPAHFLIYELDSGKHCINRYWSLPKPNPSNDSSLLLAELEDLLESSVRKQLVADVPVGVLLSGGVDSSLVTALASRVSPQNVRTFTIAFPGEGKYNEAPFAKLVSDYFGTHHTELAAKPATFEILPELARQFDEPMCDSSMVPTYLVSKLIREHCTVALGGDGGDELFGGYPTYQWALRQGIIRNRIPAPIRSLASAAASKFLPLGFRGRNYVLGLEGDLDDALARNTTFFDYSYRRYLSPLIRDEQNLQDPSAFKASLFDSFRGMPGAAMAMDFGSYLPEDILVKVDRTSMLTSLEIRAPFLDHKLIEFAFSKVPNSLRTNLSERKLLLKALARKLLPPDLDIDRKQGFSLPLKKWFSGPWGRFMEEVLRDAPKDLFNQDAIKDLFDGQKNGRANTERIFSLVLFELWRREYLIK
jgi:asparagine synthase (glutamine-hydrolysing)